MPITAATTTSRFERARASLRQRRLRCCLCANVLALALLSGCSNKHQAVGAGAGAVPLLADLAEPSGMLGELTVSRPGISYQALRDLGSPLSGLLPAGFPVLVASVLGLPPLAADSFDPQLPVFGALLQGRGGTPGWVVAVHAVSGPELVAKLCSGSQAPFRAVASRTAGLTLLEPSRPPAGSAASSSLGVFDNYLLVGSGADALTSAGPYVARMLPKRALPPAALVLRFSKQALSSQVVPALRGLWARYRTTLADSEQTERSAHGGRSPDFADPAQVILGADAVVEAALSIVADASGLELDVEPFADRLEATLVLTPEAGSDAQKRLSALAGGTASALLTLPAATQFALGFSRTSAEREAAGSAAGDDWVRVLGPRLSGAGARQLRAVLADWELGRGSQSLYGFIAGKQPGAYLVTDVADVARLRRAGSGLFGLLALPGLRAPLMEFVGQPQVMDVAAAPGADLPQASRKRLMFAPSVGKKPAVPSLSFAWLVDSTAGFAAAGKDADPLLRQVVDSEHGAGQTLDSSAHIAASVQRIGEQAALFAFLDMRVAGFGSEGALPAPMLLALGQRGSAGYLRIEVLKTAVDLALHGALGF